MEKWLFPLSCKEFGLWENVRNVCKSRWKNVDEMWKKIFVSRFFEFFSTKAWKFYFLWISLHLALVENSEKPSKSGKIREFSTSARKTAFNNSNPRFFKVLWDLKWKIEAFSTRFSTRLWKTVENLWASVNYRPWAMWISRFFGDFFEKIQKNLICNILMYSCNFVILFINLRSLCRRFLKICGVWLIGFKIAGHEKRFPFLRLI